MIVQSKAKWQEEFKSLYRGADAQLVAEEIMAIGEAATPQQIVERARDEGAELHKCFEWRDDVAAEKYRMHQARQITHHLVIEEPAPQEGEQERPPVRFFHQTVNGAGYRPTEIIYRDENAYATLLESALAELKAFQRKYSRLKELNGVFEAIDKAV